MQPLPLNFVFQGGGAKLGCLIAAADAIYEQSGRLGYKIHSVSGTSAGAIVACMLATGEDPKVFKSIIQQHGPVYIKQITRKLFYTRIVWRAWWGWPLYNTGKYTDFLGQLFTNPLLKKKYELVSDLDDKIELYVHAVDIRDRKPVIYEAKGKQKIVDILLDSSGIPFVFKTFSSSSIVDGGLVDNFPVNSISEKIDKKLTLAAPIVGISFQPDGVTWTFRNAFQYARALLSTVMDNPVNLAIRKLEKDDVHLIDTTTSTFDFDAALTHDLGDKRYSDYKKKTVDFLEKLMARKWLKQATLPSNTIVQRILKLP
jgi:NTE family protein